mgnify:CR=1 FL=1
MLPQEKFFVGFGKVDEHALCSLRAQVHVSRGVSHRASLRLEHQVEITSLSKRARAIACGTRGGVIKLVETVTSITICAVDQRIGEVRKMTGGLPDLGWRQDRCIKAHHVVA